MGFPGLLSTLVRLSLTWDRGAPRGIEGKEKKKGKHSSSLERGKGGEGEEKGEDFFLLFKPLF